MKVLAGALAAAALGAAVVWAPSLYALLVLSAVAVGVLALVLQWTAAGDPLDGEVRRWTFASYALHLGLSLGIGASGTTVTFFGGDADTYHSYSVELARHWSEGTTMPVLPAGKEGFFYVLAKVYELIGPYRFGGLALTSLCSALIVPLMADATRRLFGTRAARPILPLLVLLPGFLVWTSQLLREAPIVAALALGVCLAVRLSEEFRLAHWLVLGLTVAVLFTLRANVAYMFGAGLLVGLVMGGRHLIAGIASAAAMVGLVAVIVLGGGLGESGYQRSATADLEKVNEVRSALATTANSGIGQDADVSTPEGSLAYLPIGGTQLLLGPFPWQVRNFRQSLGLLEALTVWWLVPSFLRGLRRAWRRIGRRSTLLLAPAIGITIVLALLIGNIGTLVRERLQVLVLLLPFIALGWSRVDPDEPEQAAVPPEARPAATVPVGPRPRPAARPS